MTLAFLLDYAPILLVRQKSAYILYSIYDAFKDDNGYVSLAYNDITEHFLMQRATINEANKILLELGLIKEVDDSHTKTDSGSVVSFKKSRYQVCDVKPLSDEERQKLYAKYGLQIDTNVRLRNTRLNYIQQDFHKLFDVNMIKKAYKDLGPIEFNIAKSIAKYFKLDYNTLKRYLENDNFRKKFLEVRAMAIGDKKIKNMPKLKIGRRKKITIQEGVEALMRCHIKDNVELPRSQWNTHQLLRYFCIRYKEKFMTDYVFNSLPQASKEAKDMSQIYIAFKENGELAASYIDYVFDEMLEKLDGISTGLLKHPNMINSYMQRCAKESNPCIARVKATDKIDSKFIQWVKENTSFLQKYKLETMRDLFWTKQSFLDGNTDEDIIKVVQQAENLNLLPKGELNLKFSKKDRK